MLLWETSTAAAKTLADIRGARDGRRRSRSTPWFHRLAKNEWFDGPFERILCRRLPARRTRNNKI